jgi:APA family basic amino acid/polyamine antiporter
MKMNISYSSFHKDQGLGRRLGLFDSSMMMIGIVIGSGIFVTTGIMAKSLPSAMLILLAWGAAGLIILFGALTYAELGTTMPEAGGQYVYLKEAYGPLYGYLFGWKMFLVNMTGSIAALAVAFSEYLSTYFPYLSSSYQIFTKEINIFGIHWDYSLSLGQLLAIVVILLLTFYNAAGVGFGKNLQNLLTVIKIGTLLAFIILGFAVGKKSLIDTALNPTGLSLIQLISGFGIVLIAISWAFDGWNNINYVAGEIKNPKRNLTYALILGTLGITVLYILTNTVYFLALPIDQMSGVIRVAEKASTALFGGAAATFLTAAILVSILGALHGAIFAGSRVYYAMAKDDLFFKKIGKVHPRFKTPANAIFLQGLWACFLTLTGTFEQLITFVMFMGILFWIAAAASVFTLRKKQPHILRPYKTWGYPVVPMIFIIALSGVLVSTLISRPVESLAGLILTGLGIPIYYIWMRRK